MVLHVLVHFTKLTLDASIFRVDTVMDGKCISRTVNQSCLSSKALYIIQDNGSSSPAIVGKTSGYSTCIKMYVCDSLTFPSQSKCGIVDSKTCIYENLLKQIPVVCRLRSHQGFPRGHHTQSPRHCCCKSQLDLDQSYSHHEA